MHDKELTDLVEKMGILEKAFDGMRFVDPVNKQIINFRNNMLENTDLKCYGLWDKNKVCDNCISIRAYRDDKTYFKMDYTSDEIYIITAIPVTLSNRRVVLELFKVATDSLILDAGKKAQYNRVQEYIEGMNTLVMKDALTGSYNRRFIDERLPLDLTTAEATGKHVSVIMADIDLFKNVNDTYGHQVGDCILNCFVKLLLQSLTRSYDWVARYGGEEFLICLPGASLERAAEKAEEMRRMVEEYVFECGSNQIKITSSFGVFSMGPETGTWTGPEKMIEGADRKLYEAKRNGRNRVEA